MLQWFDMLPCVQLGGQNKEGVSISFGLTATEKCTKCNHSFDFSSCLRTINKVATLDQFLVLLGIRSFGMSMTESISSATCSSL